MYEKIYEKEKRGEASREEIDRSYFSSFKLQI